MTTDTFAEQSSLAASSYDRAAIEAVRDYLNNEESKEALALCEHRYAVNHDDLTALLGFALVAGSQQDFKTAHELLQAAHEASPTNPLAVECLAILYALAGQLGDCVYYTKLAEANGAGPEVKALLPKTWPRFEVAYTLIRERAFFQDALRAMEVGEWERAIQLLETQLSFDANDGQALRALADAYLAIDHPRKAGETLAPFLSNRTADPIDMSRAALAAASTGEPGLAKTLLQAARDLAEDPSNAEIAAASLICAVYDPDATADSLSAAAKESLAGLAAPAIVGKSSKLGTPLRVGLLAAGAPSDADLRTAGALSRYGRANGAIQTVVFGTGAQHLKRNRAFQGSGTRWLDIGKLDPETLAYTINGEDIDLLLDVGGSSAPGHLAAIGFHPAPQCLAWLGMAANLADAGGYDGALTAPLLDPQATGPCLTDGLIGLFESSIAPLPNHEDAIVFSSDVQIGQLTAPFADALGRLLQQLPNSHLLLRNRELNHPGNIDRFSELMAPYAVAEQIHIIDSTLGDLIADSHLFLSPFLGLDGYGALEAISRGRPALALAGDGRPQRFAASALHCAGLEQWVAGNIEDYIALAAELTASPASIQTASEEAIRKTKTAPCFSVTAFGESIAQILTREV